VVDKLTSVSRSEPGFHLGEKPLVVSDKPFDCLADKRIGILPALRCDPTQPEFQFGRNINLHIDMLSRSSLRSQKLRKGVTLNRPAGMSLREFAHIGHKY
jgi:hypothetical protein